MNKIKPIILKASLFAVAASAVVIAGRFQNNLISNPASAADGASASPESLKATGEAVTETIHFTGGAAGSTVTGSTYNAGFNYTSDVIYPRDGFVEYKTSEATGGAFTAHDSAYVPLNNGYTVYYESETKSGWCVNKANTAYAEYPSPITVSTLVIESNVPSEVLTINLNAPFLHGGKSYVVDSATSWNDARTDVKFIGRFRFVLSPLNNYSTYPPFIYTPNSLYITTYGENSSVYIEASNNGSIAAHNTSVIMSSGTHFDGGGTFYVNNLDEDMAATLDVVAEMFGTYAGDEKVNTFDSPVYLIQSNGTSAVAQMNSTRDFHFKVNSIASALFYCGYSTHSLAKPLTFANAFVLYNSLAAGMFGSYNDNPCSASDFDSGFINFQDTGAIIRHLSSKTTKTAFTQAVLFTGTSNPDLVYFDRASGVTGALPPAIKTNNHVSFLRGGDYTALGGWDNNAWYANSSDRTSASFVVPGSTDLSGKTVLYSGYDCEQDFRINKLLMNSTTENQCLAAMNEVVSFLSTYSSADGATYAGWRARFLGGADLEQQNNPAVYATFPEHVRRLIMWGKETGYAVQKSATEGFVLVDVNSVSSVITNSSIGVNSTPIIVMIVVASAVFSFSFVVIAAISRRKKERKQ